MQSITVSSKGQIALPKKIREVLNLSAGSKLILEVKGHQIVLSKESAWQKLAGVLAGSDRSWTLPCAHCATGDTIRIDGNDEASGAKVDTSTVIGP